MFAFGDNVFLWRLCRSLSQEKLAVLANLPRPNLSDIERGKRDVTLSTIVSLAHALKVSPGTLVDGEPPRPEKWKANLTRESMERIANSVARGTHPKDPLENHISVLLRDVIQCSLNAVKSHKGNVPVPGRKSERAWLLLQAMYSEEVINSLIMRSLEHAEILDHTTN